MQYKQKKFHKDIRQHSCADVDPSRINSILQRRSRTGVRHSGLLAHRRSSRCCAAQSERDEAHLDATLLRKTLEMLGQKLLSCRRIPAEDADAVGVSCRAL
jgi:hypothetical protein